MTNAMSKPIPKKPKLQKLPAGSVIPLWPRAIWVPDKDNEAGEKSRTVKLTLSTEPGNLNGKTLNKTFKIFRSGSPEEWILWRQDFYEICTGMSIVTGANHNRMVRQLLSDEPLKEFESQIANFATETIAHCNDALNAVAAIQVFPNNAYAKQKKYLRQGMWKPKKLSIRNAYTRVCELNQQLLSFPNQAGLLPVDELKSAFINLCSPDWQQEFLKTGINEYSSTWEEILTKAEALENAEVAAAENKATSSDKRTLQGGEVAPAAQPPKKKKFKPSYYCKLHGADQRHNTEECKVLQGEIFKLKEEKSRPSSSFSNKVNNQQKSTWTDRKRQATSYSAEQLKHIVRLTKEKTMKQAKENYEAYQLQKDEKSVEIDNDLALDRAKMVEMENFMNNLIAADESSMEDEPELSQVELEELAGDLSSD
jgi:hypothetical protein